ncbi:hypothetical protein MJL48_33175, partial [Salmonella enterica subsp. enterica serovar Kentucky]|nr:hypothetical protein [Salmonella enterica subsp. enterica serovar Kentucky]
NLGLQPYEWARLAVKKNNNKGDFGKCSKALATALTAHFVKIDHTAQGGMVILTTHQPLPGAADTVRRLALTGGGAGL